MPGDAAEPATIAEPDADGPAEPADPTRSDET
jgi:hypothetical protein